MFRHTLSNRERLALSANASTLGVDRASKPAANRPAAGNRLIESLEQRTLFSVTPDPGSDFATAFNVGQLNGQQTFGDVVGPSDLVDAYKFTMARDGQFFGRLRADSAAADITLFREHRDANGNVVEDFVASKQANQFGADGGFASGDLPVQNLTAGTYFIFVTRLGADTTYLVRMTADYAGNSIKTARDIGSASNADFQDFIGQDTSPSLNDPSDFYKVKMDANGQLETRLSLDSANNAFLAHVEYIRDANNNGVIDPGETLFSTSSLNQILIRTTLPAGTYFVRIAGDLHFSNYHLNINADYAGDSPATSRVMGPIDSGKTFTDNISTTDDPIDNYLFSVGTARPLNLAFRETGGGTSQLTLFKDRNNNGFPEPSETVLSTDPVAFDNLLTSLQAGNYILQVKAATGAGTYSLFADAPPDAAGNTLATARNLGAVNGLNHQEDFVSEDDPIDFYKFTAGAAGHVSVQLSPELGGNADLTLVRDLNNDGKVEKNEIIAASSLPLNQVDQLTASISAGTYFLEVNFNDVFAQASKYFLSFQTDFAGSTPATARNVGNLAGTRAFDDWASGPFGGIINDNADVYKFTLTSARTFTAKMTGALAGQDLNIELFTDKNHDGFLNANERIALSSNANTANEQIIKALAAGTYFLRVDGVNGETNYHLTLNA